METAGTTTKHGGGYQNYSFNELWEFIQTNPNKGLRLNKLHSVGVGGGGGGGSGHGQDTALQNTDNALGIQGMRLHFLKPTGLLSAFTWISSQLYRDAPLNLANTMSRDFGTNFIVNLDQKVSGTRFMRKRRIISEWMNTLMNLPGILTKDVELAVSTLCEVQGFHAIIVSNFSTEQGGEDTATAATAATTADGHTQTEIFFSSDPADWSNSGRPVWILDINGTWILEETGAAATAAAAAAAAAASFLSSWIEDKEKDGWKINWPPLDPDVKKTDMVELLKQSVMWKDTDEKLKKDALAPRYVRSRTLGGLRKVTYGDRGNGESGGSDSTL
jgi:hypothetical protein